MTKTTFKQIVCLLLMLCVTGSFCHAQAPAPTTPMDAMRDKLDNGLRGVLLATFMDRSPDSSIASMITRIKFRTQQPPSLYNIEDETFVLYVPKDYDPKDKYGLLVYMSNIPAMVPTEDWQRVLDDQKLIWISANNADKSKPAYRRMGMTLDAVYNATMRYTVDSDRIYIAGMHSAADLASVLAIDYPKTFAGGRFIHSCLHHRDIAATKADPIAVDEGFRRPMMDKLYRAKTENRYVLLTGDQASNLPKLKTIYNRGFLEDRFKHVQLLTIPQSNTQRPDAKWFAKAIEALNPITSENQTAE